MSFPVTPTPRAWHRVVVQKGGVLRYKWQVHCVTNGRCTAIQMKALVSLSNLPQDLEEEKYNSTNWRCIAVLFQER